MNTVTQTKTVEQLKQELQQAEEALREQERTVREREREEKRAAEQAKADAEQKVLNEKMAALLQPIYAALQSAKIECAMQGASIATSNHDTNVHIEREEHRRGSGFYSHSSYTGRFIVSVGQTFRDFPRVRYPQKKDGTFNVDKIVQTIRERIATEANAKAERVRVRLLIEQSVGLAERLQKELGTEHIVGVLESGGYDRRGRWEARKRAATPGHVYMVVGSPMLNEAQARVLVKALAEVKKLETKKTV